MEQAERPERDGALGLLVTTLEQAVNWGVSTRCGHDFRLACCAMEMIASVRRALTYRASAPRYSARHRGRLT